MLLGSMSNLLAIPNLDSAVPSHHHTSTSRHERSRYDDSEIAEPVALNEDDTFLPHDNGVPVLEMRHSTLPRTGEMAKRRKYSMFTT